MVGWLGRAGLRRWASGGLWCWAAVAWQLSLFSLLFPIYLFSLFYFVL
jgi:hypothetical protein